MGLKFKVNRPVKSGKAVYPTNYQGTLKELSDADIARLTEMKVITPLEQEAKDTDITLEDRADLVAAAVAEAIEKDPDRETQPTVATVSGITGFKVAAVEITPAYEAALAAAKEDGQQGTGNEAGSGENSGNQQQADGNTATS